MKKTSRIIGILSIISISLTFLFMILLSALDNDNDPDTFTAIQDVMGYFMMIFGFAFLILIIMYIIFRSRISRQEKKFSSVEKIDVSMAEIEKYKELFEKGIITQEEFEAKRKKILDI